MNIILRCFMSIAVGLLCSVVGERLVDLDHDYYGEKACPWPAKGIHHFLQSPVTFKTRGKMWTTMFDLEGTEHNGTYLDAPSHFQKEGWTVDQIPISHFFASAAVIDIREKVKKNAMAALSVDDINSWVKKHGSIPNNSVILVLTGWDSRYNDSEEYFGNHNSSKKIFPGIDLEAAKALITFNNLSIVGVGIDGPSIDVGSSVLFEAQRELFAANVYALENLRNIDMLPPIGAELVVMPMKIKGGSGAPCRVIARIPDTGSNSL